MQTKVLIFLFFMFLFNGVFAQTYISEHISADTRWTKSNSPYIIVNDIMIKEGVALKIEAGVSVLFSAETRFLVYGALNAKGRKNKRITFSGKDNASWNGFEFFRTCEHYDTLSKEGCVFEFCNFNGVGDAPGHLIRTRGCNLKIADSKIENCYTAVQSERQAKIYLSDNRFKGCNRPLNVRNSSLAKVTNNKFRECNSIVLGGTTEFKGNILKKFTDNGRHSGLVIWMLGGGIVNVEDNKFVNFEGNALKIQKMNKRATLTVQNNDFSGNAINLMLSCRDAGYGYFTVENNNFFNAYKSQIEIFNTCNDISARQRQYKVGKNYWGKKTEDDFKNLQHVNFDTFLKKSIR